MLIKNYITYNYENYKNKFMNYIKIEDNELINGKYNDRNIKKKKIIYRIPP